MTTLIKQGTLTATAVWAACLLGGTAQAQGLPGRGNVELLLAGQYRKSDGYPQVKGREWNELYKDTATGRWAVGSSRPKVARGRDECVGEDVLIVQPMHEQALVLFTPFAGWMREPVTSVEEQPVFPYHPLAFGLGGQHYELVPQGQVADAEGRALTPADVKGRPLDGLEYARITDYRLLMRMPDGQLHELAAVEAMDAVTPMVLWAGDINADGLPDLLLDLRDSYESRHVVLYLSDAAHRDAPPRPAATRRVVNDC